MTSALAWCATLEDVYEPRLRATLPIDWPAVIRTVLSRWVAEMPPKGQPFLGDYAHHASNRNCAGVEIEFTVLKVDEQHADITYRAWAYRPWPGECDERSE